MLVWISDCLQDFIGSGLITFSIITGHSAITLQIKSFEDGASDLSHWEL